MEMRSVRGCSTSLAWFCTSSGRFHCSGSWVFPSADQARSQVEMRGVPGPGRPSLNQEPLWRCGGAQEGVPRRRVCTPSGCGRKRPPPSGGGSTYAREPALRGMRLHRVQGASATRASPRRPWNRLKAPSNARALASLADPPHGEKGPRAPRPSVLTRGQYR